MKLIIDIDKDIAQGIIDGKGEMPRNIVRSFQATIADAIKNGIPLENANNGEIFNKVFDSTFIFVNMCADDRMRNWLNARYKEKQNDR